MTTSDGLTEPLTGSGPAERIGRLLDGAWRRYTSAPALLAVAALVALVVVRSGVALGRSDVAAVLTITEAFPDPVLDWRANSVLPYAVARTFGVTEPWQWFTLHALVLVGFVAVVVACIRARFATAVARRTAAAWLAVSSLGPVLLQRIGSYDPYTALGAFLVVLGGRVGLAVLGGVLIGLTSAEQGALGLVSALLVLVALTASAGGGTAGAGEPVGWWTTRRDRPLLRQLAAGAVGLTAARLVTLAWFARRGADVPSRSSVAGDLLDDSLRNFVAAGSAGVFAWFGLAWGLVLVGWLVGRWSRRRTMSVIGGLVAPAAMATAVTLDGTRVFVMVSLPALLVLLGWVVDRIDRAPAVDRVAVHRATAAVLVLALLVPALVTEPSGGAFFVFPWGR